MLKKIILGTLFTGLIGVLVAGAVIRTTNRLDQVGDGSGQGRGRNAQAEVSGEGRQADSNGGGQGNNQGDSRQGNGGNGQGGNGQANGGQGSGEGAGTGLANAYDWLTLEGSVTAVDDDELVVQVADGDLLIDGRAWAYALEEGFATQAGHDITITGFYEDGEFKAVELVDTTSGESVSVRDQSGRPYWAGQGRGAGS
jgi:hypothetical protein